eukprot:COSAG01_NODE_4600_length_4887_cov_2.583542_2_plen_77_part_00
MTTTPRSRYVLPQVFFGKDLIGGASVIVEGMESGTLQPLIEQFLAQVDERASSTAAQKHHTPRPSTQRLFTPNAFL